jgi:hypothetical protein
LDNATIWLFGSALIERLQGTTVPVSQGMEALDLLDWPLAFVFFGSLPEAMDLSPSPDHCSNCIAIKALSL